MLVAPERYTDYIWLFLFNSSCHFGLNSSLVVESNRSTDKDYKIEILYADNNYKIEMLYWIKLYNTDDLLITTDSKPFKSPSGSHKKTSHKHIVKIDLNLGAVGAWVLNQSILDPCEIIFFTFWNISMVLRKFQ